MVRRRDGRMMTSNRRGWPGGARIPSKGKEEWARSDRLAKQGDVWPGRVG